MLRVIAIASLLSACEQAERSHATIAKPPEHAFLLDKAEQFITGMPVVEVGGRAHLAVIYVRELEIALRAVVDDRVDEVLRFTIASDACPVLDLGAGPSQTAYLVYGTSCPPHSGINPLGLSALPPPRHLDCVELRWSETTVVAARRATSATAIELPFWCR